MSEKEKASGRIGIAPPADAPVETAQPLTPERIAAQLEIARQNEKTLPPFNPKGLRQPVAPPVVVAPVVEDGTAAIIQDFFGTEEPATLVVTPAPVSGAGLIEQLREAAQIVASVAGAADVTNPALSDPLLSPEVDQLEDQLPTLSDEDRARMPAASNSESPSRGILPSIVPPTGDKWEGISRGGFSDVGEAQYFPLAGNELIPLVGDLTKRLLDQIVNDLRFSIALVYPRLRMRLVLEIEGSEEDRDNAFQIEKVFIPKPGQPGSTALSIARQRADQIVFVVQEVRQEFSEDGQSETPPDQMRNDVGLQIPHKQQILDEFGRTVGLSDLSALTT